MFKSISGHMHTLQRAQITTSCRACVAVGWLASEVSEREILQKHKAEFEFSETEFLRNSKGPLSEICVKESRKNLKAELEQAFPSNSFKSRNQ
jgi:hypothetical protein